MNNARMTGNFRTVCAFSAIYLPISDEKLISMNLAFATMDRNVTGAPGRPLAVTWISTRELMTRGQPGGTKGNRAYADI